MFLYPVMFQVEEEEFDVLLSYPNNDHPNNLLVSENGNWRVVSNGTSTILGPQVAKEQQMDPKGKLWWNAKTTSGVAEATIVYASECGQRDFEKKEKNTQQRPQNLNGAIVSKSL